jgi:hypothetical protein
LIGRSLVVLGGAFALRAITEAAIVPQFAGMLLGLTYAVLWILLADRAAGRDRRTSATFHGFAAAIIGFPLLWEATVKFELLPATAGAIAVTGLAALALGVATRRRLPGLAWIVTLAALAAAVALAVATKSLILFFSVLLLLALATLHLAYLRDWRGLGWLTAVAIDCAVLLATLIVLIGNSARSAELVPAGQLVTLQLSLVGGYVVSFIYRTLATRRDLTAAEIAQGIAVAAIGLGGAMAVSRTGAMSVLPLGVMGMALGAGCYGASFVLLDRTQERRVNFIFFTTLAMLSTVISFEVLFAGLVLVLGFALLAVVTAWLGVRGSRATLSLHSAVYATAAAVTSGLVASSFDCYVGATVPGVDWISVGTVGALLTAGVCCWFPVATHGRTWGRLSQLPKLVVLGVMLAALGGVLITLGSSFLPAGDNAALAALRTGVLALSALAVAFLGRWPRVPEAAWLIYPVLAAGGLKLILEDFRLGRPATLFISLGLYGGALILAPRIGRKRK